MPLTHPIWQFHPPSTTFRCPIGSSTDAPSGTVRMRPTHPIWQCHPPSTTLRGPIGSSTDGPSATARM
eukprot:4043974-Pyramimonas_sp.AAC.1